jgi:hypothetical protein
MRIKAKTLIALLLAGCVASTAAFALDMNGVIAFPVPYNPARGPMTIRVPVGDSIKIQIYDINGDPVYDKSGSNGDNLWSGRNNSGRKIKPGLYIIKVTAEDSTSGDYGKKLIRILVDYR